MTRFKLFKYMLIAPIFILALFTAMLPIYPASAEEDVVGEWQVMCSVNHTLKDDPIVYPGKPGASHMHSFYGNKSTNANTTAESLMASASNCGRNMETTDRSAYWVPSVYQKQADGSLKLVADDRQIAFIYYERVGGNSGPKVKPFPVGLRMIAGNMHATSPQAESVTFWACGGGGGGPRTGHIPTCNEAGQPIHATLFFPNCWDGKNLDSADHKSHMAYAGQGGACPSTHPVSLPRLNYNLDYYGVKGGPNYVLASGNGYTMHGDFFAAWDNRAQNALVSECLNTPRPCIGIERQGDTIIKPSYDPDPIPKINLANFSSSSPHVLGAQTPVTPPAPAPTTADPHAGHTQGTQTQNPQQNSQSNQEEVSELPSTGATSVLAGSFILALLTYLFYNYRVRKQSLLQTIKLQK